MTNMNCAYAKTWNDVGAKSFAKNKVQMSTWARHRVSAKNKRLSKFNWHDGYPNNKHTTPMKSTLNRENPW